VRSIIVLRQDGKLTAFIFIEQAAKNKGTVKSRPAKPVDVGVFIDMGQVGAIADNAGVINVFLHVQNR